MSTLQSAARSFMYEAEGDLNKAKEIARAKLREDTTFAKMLRPILVEYAIERILDDQWRAGRADHWQRSIEETDMESVAASVVAAPAARAEIIRPRVLQKGETSQPSTALMGGLHQELQLTGHMAFPMPKGTMLGDWQRTHLEEFAAQVISQGRSTMATGYFLKNVAAQLPNRSVRVRDVLTNNDLDRIMRQQNLTKAILPNMAALPQGA